MRTQVAGLGSTDRHLGGEGRSGGEQTTSQILTGMHECWWGRSPREGAERRRDGASGTPKERETGCVCPPVR